MKIPLISDPTQETDHSLMTSRIENLERVFWDVVRNNLNDDLVIATTARTVLKAMDDVVAEYTKKYATIPVGVHP